MSEHTVQSYDSDLKDLRSALLRMGNITLQMLKNATTAMTTRDAALAQQVVSTDNLVDTLQRTTEEKAVLTIARRQPVAVDLRALVSAIRIAADIERIGDLSKNIAKRAGILASSFQVPASMMVGLDHMSRAVVGQYSRAIEAYGAQDAAMAEGVWRNDAEVDGLYTLIFRESLTYMMEEPRNITFCTHLLFCIKNLERIGDHATNIAETVYYIETGHILEGERPRLDNTDIALAATP